MHTHLQTVISKPRKSNYELLRLVSQFYIVLYHIFMISVVPNNPSSFYKAIQMPLHIGVILFVLLSGYFSIRPSSKGFIKLIGIFIVYSSVEVLYKLLHADSIKEAVWSLFFITNTHFWFIKTYLFLYLVSPLLNILLDNASSKRMWYLLLVLGFVSIYMGTTGGDVNMSDGKNLVNFVFLYFVGSQIRIYQNSWDKTFSLSQLIIFYIALNVILVLGYTAFADGLLGKIIYKLSFPYASPILLINSIIFFMIFGKIEIQSDTINWLAKSSLAIYLIHGNRPYVVGFWGGAFFRLDNRICPRYINGFCG